MLTHGLPANLNASPRFSVDTGEIRDEKIVSTHLLPYLPAGAPGGIGISVFEAGLQGAPEPFGLSGIAYGRGLVVPVPVPVPVPENSGSARKQAQIQEPAISGSFPRQRSGYSRPAGAVTRPRQRAGIGRPPAALLFRPLLAAAVAESAVRSRAGGNSKSEFQNPKSNLPSSRNSG